MKGAAGYAFVLVLAARSASGELSRGTRHGLLVPPILNRKTHPPTIGSPR